MTEVSQLLAQSLNAHHKAKTKPKRDQRGSDRASDAQALWTLARDLRVQALALDPERLDPAWGAERVDHEVYMIFYHNELGPLPGDQRDIGELGKTHLVPVPEKLPRDMKAKIEQARQETGFELKDVK